MFWDEPITPITGFHPTRTEPVASPSCRRLWCSWIAFVLDHNAIARSLGLSDITGYNFSASCTLFAVIILKWPHDSPSAKVQNVSRDARILILEALDHERSNGNDLR